MGGIGDGARDFHGWDVPWRGGLRGPGLSRQQLEGEHCMSGGEMKRFLAWKHVQKGSIHQNSMRGGTVCKHQKEVTKTSTNCLQGHLWS